MAGLQGKKKRNEKKKKNQQKGKAGEKVKRPLGHHSGEKRWKPYSPKDHGNHPVRRLGRYDTEEVKEGRLDPKRSIKREAKKGKS